MWHLWHLRHLRHLWHSWIIFHLFSEISEKSFGFRFLKFRSTIVVVQNASGFFILQFVKMHPSKHDRCRMDGCSRSASFGVPPSRRRIYCKMHKEASMANVSNPLCRTPECAKQATFGFSCGPRCVFCSRHKEAGMVHTSKKQILATEVEISRENPISPDSRPSSFAQTCTLSHGG